MDKVAIGKRLLELREYIGLTRKSLSSIIKIPPITIQAWENGWTTIRKHNLVKYLEELNKLGCSTTIEWVLGEAPLDSRTLPINSREISGKSAAIELNDMIEVFKIAKNCFYFLSQAEEVLYLNNNLVHLLGKPQHSNDTFSQIPFENLCSLEVYKTCHERFMVSPKIKKQTFTYNVQNLYNNTHWWEVEVVYHSLFKTKSTHFLGIVCFVLNQENFLG